MHDYRQNYVDCGPNKEKVEKRKLDVVDNHVIFTAQLEQEEVDDFFLLVADMKPY